LWQDNLVRASAETKARKHNCPPLPGGTEATGTVLEVQLDLA